MEALKWCIKCFELQQEKKLEKEKIKEGERTTFNSVLKRLIEYMKKKMFLNKVKNQQSL